jgi:hypothetical protein
MVPKVLCISCMMDLNVSCVSCVVVAKMRRTREGGWDVGDSGVDGGWLWIPNVMVLDRSAVGTCLRREEGLILISCFLTRDLSFTFYRWRRLKA